MSIVSNANTIPKLKHQDIFININICHNLTDLIGTYYEILLINKRLIMYNLYG